MQKQLSLAKKGINLIIGEEVGSRADYDQLYSKPTWPGGDSGVTFGIGYDCGFNSKEQIRKDWEGRVNGNILSFMLSCAGKKGLVAKKMITPETKTFKIPYDVAFDVFSLSTLPRYCDDALESFEGLEELNSLTQAMVVSVVFNRGSRKTDIDVRAKDREEMRDLAVAIKNKDYVTIANEIESMKRLWDGVPDYEGDKEQKFTGLVNRRIKEANLVRISLNEIVDSKDEITYWV